MPRIPPIFVSHGAGELAEGRGGEALAAWAKTLPRPRAILVVSAHWQAASLTRGSTAAFPAASDDPMAHAPRATSRYAAPGAPELAYELASILPVERSDRGWDEGVWAPLSHMFPEADVPILQLSLVTGRTPRASYALGRKIGVLASHGVLLVGSGNFTTNERDDDPGDERRRSADGGRSSPRDDPPATVRTREIDAFFANALADADAEALLSFRTTVPNARRAHPTAEHLDPLYVMAGAASLHDHAVGFPVRGFERGISRRCVQFGA